MLAAHEAHHHQGDATLAQPLSNDLPRAPIVPHAYRPPASTRVFGSLGSVVICALIAVGLFVTLNRLERPKIAPGTVAVTLLPLTTSERQEPKKAEKRKPVEKKQTKPEPREPAAQTRPLVFLPPPEASPVVPQSVAPSPAPPVPPIAPVPPAPAPATPSAQLQPSHGPDTWEGRVLARLEKFRRYPGDAERARQQGTAYIRFRIDRSGHVLSSSLERSSGSPALDEAAMETLRRAEPLPKIPPDRPDEIELVVPIEFSINR